MIDVHLAFLCKNVQCLLSINMIYDCNFPYIHDIKQFFLFLGGPYPGQQSYAYGAPDQYGPPPQPPGQYPPAQGQFPPPNRTMYPPYGGAEGDT